MKVWQVGEKAKHAGKGTETIGIDKVQITVGKGIKIIDKKGIEDEVPSVNIVYAREELDLLLDTLAKKTSQDVEYQGILDLLRSHEG